MSISLSLMKGLLRASGIKRQYDRSTEELIAMHKKKNQRRVFDIKPEPGMPVEKIRVGDREVLILKNSKTLPARALLYFYGGGFVGEMSGLEKHAAVRYGKGSARDVWIPRYPNGADVSVRGIYQMALETYRKMLDVYEPEQIAVIGFSAGASIGLGMFEYNNTLKKPLPVPELLILSSPACIPATEQEREAIKKLADADLMIPASFVHTIYEIMCHGETLPDYMTQLTTGDLSNMPYTHIYYGTDEVLSAAAEPLTAAFHKYGSRCELHMGQGLFHCYPAVDKIPETKAAFDEIIGLLHYT